MTSLSLMVVQLNLWGAVQLSGYALVTVADTGANLAALTSGQIGALAGESVEVPAASYNTLVLTRAQYQAPGTMTVTAGGNTVLADTVGNWGALTAAQYGGLPTAGFNRIHVTNGTLC